MTSYSKGPHTVYHHRYHIVWITKYRYRVLTGEVGMRVREIISQVADEMVVKILALTLRPPKVSLRHF